ncbi:MAG: bifunctional riboflavin kinase/FAD synthetase [Neisseriaceae bacterium]|nr:bifunctional riboflavin kinase/FAD synthetase [Neisseriaceae bacterium]
MNIYLGQSTCPHFADGVALTIGNFDGVHLGHCAILKQLRQAANERNLPTAIMLFEPQPVEYFSRLKKIQKPFRLTPLRDKLQLLANSGSIDNAWVVRFNQSFAQQTANDFIHKILIDSLNVKYLLIGDDFRFGRQRQGNLALLQQQTHFETAQMSSVLLQGRRASSTAVRQALCTGDLLQAHKILGRPYAVSGKVMHGKKLGRTLGCPTANIYVPPHHYPLHGVYVVDVLGDFGRKRGVANFGYNPTVANNTQQHLEVHLFDFSGDLYGKRLQVVFLSKIRDEQKFNHLDELKQQIQHDMNTARHFQIDEQMYAVSSCCE